MNRERLPNRRAAETFEIEVNGLRYTATVSRFADGRIGELFLTNHKSTPTPAIQASRSRSLSSTARIHARSAARSVAIHTVAPPVRSEPRLISCWGMNHEHRRAATAVKKSAAPDAAGGATVD